MATSRRNFLKTGTAVALTAGVGLNVKANSLVSSAGLLAVSDSITLDMASFVRTLQTDFLLSNSSRSATVRLTEVRNRRVGGLNKKAKECFSLIFSGPKDDALAQDTYSAKHAELGEFSMLVVPVGGNNYEAVFNRL